MTKPTNKNDITGDKLVTKANSDKYRANWDKIFSREIATVLECDDKTLKANVLLEGELNGNK